MPRAVERLLGMAKRKRAREQEGQGLAVGGRHSGLVPPQPVVVTVTIQVSPVPVRNLIPKFVRDLCRRCLSQEFGRSVQEDSGRKVPWSSLAADVVRRRQAVFANARLWALLRQVDPPQSGDRVVVHFASPTLRKSTGQVIIHGDYG